MSAITIINAIMFRIWPLLLIILLLWVLYWYFTRRGKVDDKLPPWQTKLWISVLAITVLLILASVVIMVAEFDENSDKQYVPSHMEDGKLIRGHME